MFEPLIAPNPTVTPGFETQTSSTDPTPTLSHSPQEQRPARRDDNARLCPFMAVSVWCPSQDGR